MKRSLLILIIALATGLVVFAASYQFSQRLCVKQTARSGDDLEWLRQEFQLGDDELAKVRTLHEGYLPQCAEMCRQIAAKKREVETALAGTTDVTPAAREKVAELGVLRASCQTQMLQHFAEVSQAMPPEQGRRYLAEMQRVTLGTHEQIEQSMSDPAGQAHGQE